METPICCKNMNPNNMIKSNINKENKQNMNPKMDDPCCPIVSEFDNNELNVTKRNGKTEPVSFDKIQNRIKELSYGLCGINYGLVSKKVINELFDGIQTSKLDELTAQIAISMITTHPNYGVLASRIEVSNLHKTTTSSFSEMIKTLFDYVNPNTSQHYPLISKEIYDIVMKNKKLIDSAICYSRDYDFDYFGIKTLSKSYLFKMNNKIIERPQHMFMRTAIELHRDNMTDVIETYEYLSKKYFIHATPTLFNSCTPNNQLASCFLLKMKEDSIEGIFETLGQCAKISKHCGGIGLNVSNIRSRGSYIKGTNGYTNGICPMLRIYNETARYVDQGGGKRKGSFAVYIEPWHADIFSFLLLKKNTGKEEERCRDLFLSLWIPDLFMKRVLNDDYWSLMCPDQCPHLCESYGDEFDKLYVQYENQNKFVRRIKARKIWKAIISSQIETGQPFMLYKDACNLKSNQKNIGPITTSNLCTEIVQYTGNDEIAVCVLASLSLPKFVFQKKFDFSEMGKVISVVIRNLNKVIDHNKNPLPECERSVTRNRAIGLGVQGLADVFMMLELPFDSPEAKKLNIEIFENIYFYALQASCELSFEQKPYHTFIGSPASKGNLQFDLWNIDPLFVPKKKWDQLKKNIKNNGLRNSLLLAMMPTASTSQILGNNESCEPYTSNLYIRRTLAGEFVVINKHLLKNLMDRGLWSETIKNKIIIHNGSIQNIPEIPEEIKQLYKTVWEIKQKDVIDMYADRAPFIDQSQSMNVHIKEPTYQKLSSMHVYAWRKGLKTGMYYLRTQPATDAIKFTINPKELETARLDQCRSYVNKDSSGSNQCVQQVPEQECIMCSS